VPAVLSGESVRSGSFIYSSSPASQVDIILSLREGAGAASFREDISGLVNLGRRVPGSY
jgi:hypothetical protein